LLAELAYRALVGPEGARALVEATHGVPVPDQPPGDGARRNSAPAAAAAAAAAHSGGRGAIDGGGGGSGAEEPCLLTARALWLIDMQQYPLLRAHLEECEGAPKERRGRTVPE